MLHFPLFYVITQLKKKKKAGLVFCKIEDTEGHGCKINGQSFGILMWNLEAAWLFSFLRKTCSSDCND